MRRRDFIKALGATAAGWPIGASAQHRPAETVPPTAGDQPTALTQSQLDALDAYDRALNHFRSILSERRTQIGSHHPLPNLPGQALYLARISRLARSKSSRRFSSIVGRTNKFGIPPAYFDADIEPLIEEYRKLFDIMGRRPPTRKTRILQFMTLWTLEFLARARALMRQMPKQRAVSALVCSLPRPMASNTLGMRARMNTREVCKLIVKTEMVKRNGQQSRIR